MYIVNTHTKNMLVSFQGEHGAYSEEAALLWNDKAKTVPTHTFADAIEQAISGLVQAAVIPVENTTEGLVSEANHTIWDKRNDIHITDEVYYHVKHCLIGNTTRISDIETIYSHPQALGQCRKFVSAYKTVPTYDTAGSVDIIKKMGTPDVACIASKRAADHYKCHIIKQNIQDIPDNYTRFVIIKPGRWRRGSTSSGKMSIAFTLPHKPGSLYQVLWLFRHTNLTRIISLPERNVPWNYAFFLDFVGEVPNLDSVREACVSFNVLGTYPVKDQVYGSKE